MKKFHIKCERINLDKTFYLVVSMTNVKGGFITSFPTETGHSIQLQATQRPAPFGPEQSASEVHEHPSLTQGSDGNNLYNIIFRYIFNSSFIFLKMFYDKLIDIFHDLLITTSIF